MSLTLIGKTLTKKTKITWKFDEISFQSISTYSQTHTFCLMPTKKCEITTELKHPNHQSTRLKQSKLHS